MAFFFCCLVCLFIGRKAGWVLSRLLLYSVPTLLAVILCLFWGIGIAYGYRLLITNLHPGILLAIFGFMAGGYISIPNYGLIAESTIPEGGKTRHDIVSNLPFLMYLAASVLLYFTKK